MRLVRSLESGEYVRYCAPNRFQQEHSKKDLVTRVIKVSSSEALLLTPVAREVANILRTERGTIHASKQVKKL